MQSTSIPHCHAFDVIELRGTKMSTGLAVKALASAVTQVPIMNATLDPSTETYAIPAGVHVGVAVTTPSGLAVPCVRDAQDKTIGDIASDIARLRKRALEQRLSREDVQDGTITLSNIGSIGLMSGLGVIQPTQAALVTVGKVSHQEGTMHVTVSADHRLIDGHILAAFLAEFRKAITSSVPV